MRGVRDRAGSTRRGARAGARGALALRGAATVGGSGLGAHPHVGCGVVGGVCPETREDTKPKTTVIGV